MNVAACQPLRDSAERALTGILRYSATLYGLVVLAVAIAFGRRKIAVLVVLIIENWCRRIVCFLLIFNCRLFPFAGATHIYPP